MLHSKNQTLTDMKYNITSKTRNFAVLGLIALAVGCTNLETNEVDSIIIETGDGVPMGNPEELLAALYNSDMGAFTDQANIYALFTHTTDEMIPPSSGTDCGDNGVWRHLHQHTWDPTHSYVLGTWNQLNERVFKCNQILGFNPTPEQAAQAKFLRAFFLWHVMDLFGK